MPNFVLICLFLRPLAAKTHKFCRFGLRHFVVSPFGSNLTNLHSYKQGSNSFLYYSEAFVAKSDAQSLTFSSVRNKQTDKKTQRSCPSRRRVKFEPHQTWHGEHVLVPLKLLGSDIVSPLGSTGNLGETRPTVLKTPITP